MSGRRSYSSGTEKSLFQLSRGYCYAPNCLEPVARKIDGEHIVHVEIAHIRAKSDGGPRFDPELPEERRDDFDNLLLLCSGHHKLVDGKATWRNYSVELLREWKEEREGDQAEQLEGLRGLTEGRLQELISEAIDSTKEDLDAALSELSNTSKEAAELLRSMLNESFERPYLDLDSIASLERSAHMLQTLPDDAGILAQSAHILSDLGDNAASLRQATENLKSLEDHTPALIQASESIGGLAANSRSLHDAAEKISEAVPGGILDDANSLSYTFQRISADGSILSEIPRAVGRMEKLAEQLSDAPPVLEVDDQQRWLYFKVGAGIGAAVPIILFVLWFTANKPA